MISGPNWASEVKESSLSHEKGTLPPTHMEPDVLGGPSLDHVAFNGTVPLSAPILICLGGKSFYICQDPLVDIESEHVPYASSCHHIIVGNQVFGIL